MRFFPQAAAVAVTTGGGIATTYVVWFKTNCENTAAQFNDKISSLNLTEQTDALVANNTALINAVYQTFQAEALAAPGDFLPLPSILDTDRAWYNCSDTRWSQLDDFIDVTSLQKDSLPVFKSLLRYEYCKDVRNGQYKETKRPLVTVSVDPSEKKQCLDTMDIATLESKLFLMQARIEALENYNPWLQAYL